MIDKGVDFLVHQQRADGSWPPGVHDDGILTTSLSTLALARSRSTANSTSRARDAMVEEKIVFGMLETLNDSSIPGGTYRENHILAVAMNLNSDRRSQSESSDEAWQIKLIDRLARAQNQNGSWGGVSDPTEADPVLATAYAILALTETRNALP